MSVLVLILFTLFILVAFKIVTALWSFFSLVKCFKPVPGWPTHWLYGNLHQKQKGDYYIQRSRWASQNRIKVSKEWWGPFLPALIIQHPEIWKQLVNKPKASEMYNLIHPWLGDGLLLATGKRWARNRKLLTAAFHFETIKPYMQVYNECVDILITRWTECALQKKKVYLHQDISKLTLDILLRCSFSHNTNCQMEEIQYTKAVKDLSVLTIDRFFSVMSTMMSNFIYLNFTPQGRKYKIAANLVHSYAENVIAERRKTLATLQSDVTVKSSEIMSRALKKGDYNYIDFLDILLTARDENGQGLTDLEIRYEVDTFLFEGHDTTSHGLTWTLYCLAKYPEHQEKCREQVDQVMSSKNSLEYSDLSDVSYIQWCIKEAMRLYPPVYGVVRKLNEDTVIDGYKIPKDTLLDIMSVNIHQNSEFWEDPEVFNPLRFHPDKISKQHPYAYTPFSAGPRNCIGQNFAMNEMRVVVAMILRKFELHLPETTTVELYPALLYSFKDDIPLTLELRSN